MIKSRRTASISPAQRITAAIIEKFEEGTKPWVKPWRGVPLSRPLRSCGTPYRGMNTFWLWMVADACGYASPYWMTYRQCQKLGGQVRKGEKSTIAIFYKSYTKEVENSEGGQDTESRRVLKAYSVFNPDQCDGLPEFYHPKPLVAALEPEGREEEGAIGHEEGDPRLEAHILLRDPEVEIRPHEDHHHDRERRVDDDPAGMPPLAQLARKIAFELG